MQAVPAPAWIQSSRCHDLKATKHNTLRFTSNLGQSAIRTLCFSFLLYYYKTKKKWYQLQTGWGLDALPAPRSGHDPVGKSALRSSWTCPTPGCSCLQSWKGWALGEGGTLHRTHCCSGHGRYQAPMPWTLTKDKKRKLFKKKNYAKTNTFSFTGS